ncbi:MAG: helix-hairpin-helix domain-containing protein [Anaerolineae bacterium]|nr:helix-hairpin-helix domain-containing protein [Anaerolineae bacterium]
MEDEHAIEMEATDEVELSPPLDLNQAALETLLELPGIDETLARRIIAYREERGPFLLPEEVTAVEGITPEMFEQWAGHIVAEMPARLPEQKLDIVTPEELPEPDVPEPVEAGGESEPLPKALPAPEKQPKPPAPPRPAPRPGPAPRRGPGWWAWVGAVFLGAILGLLFSLIVFAGINGSLDVSRSPAMIATRNDIKDLDARLATLGGEIDGLRKRLDVLEGLTARMEKVETQVNDLGKDVAALNDQAQALREAMGTLQARVDGMDERLEKVAAWTQRAEGFFQGLRLLLEDTFGGTSTAPATPND